MTLEQALQKIKENWATLPHETIDGHEAVWVVTSDTGEGYETDIETIGMKGDGTLVWAYASGCSCWYGDYSTGIIHDEHIKTTKAFAFNHENMAAEWKNAIIKFAETFKEVEI